MKAIYVVELDEILPLLDLDSQLGKDLCRDLDQQERRTINVSNYDYKCNCIFENSFILGSLQKHLSRKFEFRNEKSHFCI